MKAKSTHAAAAAAIRAELKKHGVPGSVTSKTYAGGCSVTATLINPAPWTLEKVRAFVGQFEYGSFDGMTDCYNYDNCREDIPQVKYTFVNADYSDDMKQKAYDYLRAYWGYKDYPEKYSEAANLRGGEDWIHTEVHRVLSGCLDKYQGSDAPFWIKPHIKLAA